MNAIIEKDLFIMSDPLTKDEIQEMIDHAVRDGVRDGIVAGLDEWQNKYNLTAAHWVYLDSEFRQAREANSHLIKTALTIFITVMCTLLALGVNSFISTNSVDVRSGATVKSEKNFEKIQR